MNKLLYWPWPKVMQLADLIESNGFTKLAQETRLQVWNEAERLWKLDTEPQVGELISIKSKSGMASHRTKNRLKQHGDRFKVLGGVRSVIAMNNRNSVLVVSLKTEWTGWFPMEEITFKRSYGDGIQGY